ncbi:carboxylesterase [Bacillus coahuilensis m2-6]|uniref:alpha/beta hydrolase n=1 Tax=Bacillus coahuilensis TaxID=408580 RepID=UPI000750438B|nr:alpha/beta hydrolase [Bacillus coahuilensis]KUP09520.1 carboxylesterase [Bacillus coahuilensis m2-6]
MKYVYKEAKDPQKPILLLLHGTGGNEEDLLPLAEMIDRDAGVLSVRGSVLENGMPRFFKRLAEGVFDEKDLIERTDELYAFLDHIADEQEFDRNRVIAIGYSNGANIAGSLLFHHPHSLKAAILHHPMVPRRGITIPNLESTPVFIAAGTNDPICSLEESKELADLLKGAGSDVTLHWEHRGHQLTLEEVKAAKEWYDQLNF